MKDTVVSINSVKITEVVCDLCKQANIFISKDVYNALLNSYKQEKSQKAKYTISQILENFKLAAESSRPICQDTGIVVVFIDIGQNVTITGDTLENAVNYGVEKAYKDNFFRNSIVADPIFDRINTNSNTPAIIYTTLIPGDLIKITVSVKGCGCENMSAVKMLKPSSGIEGIVEFAVDTLKSAGANTCPPVRLGIGIGGTLEYAAILAKKALIEPIKSIEELEQIVNSSNAANLSDKRLHKLELTILRKVNDLKIGASGLGGDFTAFGVNILSYPTHIAALPVTVNINCHASRHAKAEITPEGVIYHSDIYEHDFIGLENRDDCAVNIDTNNISGLRKLKAGDMVLLNGYVYTARDAAHKRLYECITSDKEMPIDLKDKIIYYTGPCPASENEIIGPAGPTTSIRMDKYTPALMNNGLFGTIGKGVRSEEVINDIRKYGGIYLATTGGAANLLGQKIIEAEVIAYPDLGTEAIYRFKLHNFPAIVAIDSRGNNIFA